MKISKALILFFIFAIFFDIAKGFDVVKEQEEKIEESISDASGDENNDDRIVILSEPLDLTLDLIWTVDQLYYCTRYCVDKSITLDRRNVQAVCMCYYEKMAAKYDFEFFMNNVETIKTTEAQTERDCLEEHGNQEADFIFRSNQPEPHDPDSVVIDLEEI